MATQKTDKKKSFLPTLNPNQIEECIRKDPFLTFDTFQEERIRKACLKRICKHHNPTDSLKIDTWARNRILALLESGDSLFRPLLKWYSYACAKTVNTSAVKGSEFAFDLAMRDDAALFSVASSTFAAICNHEGSKELYLRIPSRAEFIAHIFKKLAGPSELVGQEAWYLLNRTLELIIRVEDTSQRETIQSFLSYIESIWEVMRGRALKGAHQFGDCHFNLKAQIAILNLALEVLDLEPLEVRARLASQA